MRVDISVGLQLLFGTPVFYVSVEEDCTGGLVIEVYDDTDKVAYLVLFHGCQQICMPNPA